MENEPCKIEEGRKGGGIFRVALWVLLWSLYLVGLLIIAP